MQYVQKLLFDEKPDYAYLRKLFRDVFTARGYVRQVNNYQQ